MTAAANAIARTESIGRNKICCPVPISADTPYLPDAYLPEFKLDGDSAFPTRACFQISVGDIFLGDKHGSRL